MALQLQIRTPSSFTTTKPYYYHLLLSTTKSKFTVIKSQNTPIDTESTQDSPKKPKPISPGQGFGSSSSTPGKPTAASVTKKKKANSKRERASVIRRAPVQKPAFVSQEDEAKAKEMMKNESAFLLAWLGIGGVILLQGITLAASGFLPEELDKFFVKYLYPTFTPTVVLFVAGTVAYGVVKYLQNEKLRDQK
ncbi:protein LOW PSII ACCUMULATION 2, chloroplastic [Pistacia vera]|uniref:protein LOW PSII ACCUMULATION 2, chloroplastic n=1 Tax=Pistacia vera TaxID=55513 RepID=UPI0012631555|nr:protein LOW PSII ACCUMULATION 2, chloroplastic [Pistacia vera]XP_031265872.1 protein LOW PSII ACCUMULATION 2, chloroplastic [Pistacia vera]XP_031265873.1 protein LOW PSII ACCUMULATION 2, chloroplastic [Pistacia vera]